MDRELKKRSIYEKILLIMILSLGVSPSQSKITEHHKHVALEVQAVLGNMAELPCDLSVSPGDHIRLVLWSKNSTVIYSVDARSNALEDAQHWSNEHVLSGRAFFKTELTPPRLLLENVQESDAGFYKCRIDYKRSPTLYRAVNLTVILPPRKLTIMDEAEMEVNSMSIGPYPEGSMLRLTCIATGGWPVPKVTWWRENSLLDDSYEVSSETDDTKIVSNTLTINRLQRSDLNARLTCQAANNNISVPVSKIVEVDMTFRPLSVRLKERKQPLSADKEYRLTCRSSGARPAAVISWWKGTTPLKRHKEVTSHDGNTTTSTLVFVPTLEDGNKFLACRAENPRIPGSAIEDGWKMNIQYVPRVELMLGSTLNSSQIREGGDVYFECFVKANPWIQKISWRHNNRLLHHNTSAGIIISNQSLVLQRISRESEGLYTCVGKNQEGDGTSNAVYLNVKYAPVCKENQQTIYGIGRQESARILCQVDGNPEDGLTFKWKFNNTAETIDIQQSNYQVDGSQSILTYKPMTEHDYGTVLCWASHSLTGVQKIPCVYHIIPAGKPDPVSNCSILNQTFDSLFVSCIEGYNGGLQQHFVIEIMEHVSQTIVKNFTNARPIFRVRGLEPNSRFVVRVYAFNSKGKSETQILNTNTLKPAQKQTGINAAASSVKPAFLQLAPLYAIVIAIVILIIFIAGGIVLVIGCRSHGSGEDKRLPKNNGLAQPQEPDKSSSVPLKKSSDDVYDSDDKNPDVIPHSSDVEGVDPDEKVFLERLNNSSRFYETIPRAVRTSAIRPDPNLSIGEGINHSKNKTLRTPRNGREEVTYVELSLPNSPAYQHHPSGSKVQGPQLGESSHGTLRHVAGPSSRMSTDSAGVSGSAGTTTTTTGVGTSAQDPVIYAQIDPTKSMLGFGSVQEQQTQTVPSYTSSACSIVQGHPPEQQQSEECVRLRPENAHAVYATNGSNIRF